jgi:hypothetical protein
LGGAGVALRVCAMNEISSLGKELLDCGGGNIAQGFHDTLVQFEGTVWHSFFLS